MIAKQSLPAQTHDNSRGADRPFRHHGNLVAQLERAVGRDRGQDLDREVNGDWAAVDYEAWQLLDDM
jgi:hypothetical protein